MDDRFAFFLVHFQGSNLSSGQRDHLEQSLLFSFVIRLQDRKQVLILAIGIFHVKLNLSTTIRLKLDEALRTLEIVDVTILRKTNHLASFGRDDERLMAGDVLMHIAQRITRIGTLQPQRVLPHRHSGDDVVHLVHTRKVLIQIGIHRTDGCIKGWNTSFTQECHHIIGQSLAIAKAPARHLASQGRLVAANAQLDADIPGVVVEILIETGDLLPRGRTSIRQFMHLCLDLSWQIHPVLDQTILPLAKILPGVHPTTRAEVLETIGGETYLGHTLICGQGIGFLGNGWQRLELGLDVISLLGQRQERIAVDRIIATRIAGIKLDEVDGMSDRHIIGIHRTEHRIGYHRPIVFHRPLESNRHRERRGLIVEEERAVVIAQSLRQLRHLQVALLEFLKGLARRIANRRHKRLKLSVFVDRDRPRSLSLALGIIDQHHFLSIPSGGTQSGLHMGGVFDDNGMLSLCHRSQKT